jgi:hypothetical protein
MGLLDRPRTFPEVLEQNGIVFRYTQSYDSQESAMNEAYFQRKRGNYARIISRLSKIDGNKRWGVYIARKQ